MRRLSFLLLLPLLLAVRASDIEEAWMNLPSTQNACSEVYDYFPNGGMRVFYCHAQNLIALGELERMSKQAIFLSGPHKGTRLDLKNAGSFGHYNPAFVDWMADTLIPGAQDSNFRTQSQGVYDAQIAPLARIHWLSWQKLQANSACNERELNLYRKQIEKGASNTGGLYGGAWYERWFFFMNHNFCKGRFNEDELMQNGFDGGVDGNVTKTAVGFWLRREMDGTAPKFANALKKLLQTYDDAWLKENTRVSEE